MWRMKIRKDCLDLGETERSLMPKPVTPPTTAQSLGALLKSARDIMRKDILLRQGYGGQEGSRRKLKLEIQ